jgi:hypothetical protein
MTTLDKYLEKHYAKEQEECDAISVKLTGKTIKECEIEHNEIKFTFFVNGSEDMNESEPKEAFVKKYNYTTTIWT